MKALKENLWLDVISEGAEIVEDCVELDILGVDEGFIVVPTLEAIVNEGADLDKVVRQLHKKVGSDGWTRDEILADVDPAFIHHAEHFHKLLFGGVRPDGTKFKGGGGLRWGRLEVKGGEAILTVKGSLEYDKPQQEYTQRIRFSNFGKISRLKDLNWLDKSRALLRDHLKVHCDCPAFQYYYAHAAHQKGLGLKAEKRAANVTNPRKKGSVCKHLHVVLKWLGGQHTKFASEMKSYHEKK